MFRITTRGADGELVLTLEGYLTGPWVQELETCWHHVVEAAPGAQVQVDFSSLCRVDSRGAGVAYARCIAPARGLLPGDA